MWNVISFMTTLYLRAECTPRGEELFPHLFSDETYNGMTFMYWRVFNPPTISDADILQLKITFTSSEFQCIGGGGQVR